MMKKTEQPTTWKTRDGRVMKLTEMETSHLQNLVRFLRRKAAQAIEGRILAGYAAATDDLPDGAFDALTSETRALERMDVDEFLARQAPVFLAVKDELKRRSLSMPPKIPEDEELARLWANPHVRAAARFLQLRDEVRDNILGRENERIMNEIMRDESWGDS